MENQDMMTNNEVMEVAEEVMETGSCGLLKLGLGAAAIVGLGYGVYRLVKKIKDNKKQYVPYEELQGDSNDYVEEEID